MDPTWGRDPLSLICSKCRTTSSCQESTVKLPIRSHHKIRYSSKLNIEPGAAAMFVVIGIRAHNKRCHLSRNFKDEYWIFPHVHQSSWIGKLEYNGQSGQKVGRWRVATAAKVVVVDGGNGRKWTGLARTRAGSN